MRNAQAGLFIDPQVKYPIDDLSLSFTDYITQCKGLIAQHRFDLHQTHSDQIMLANAPFELRPEKPSRCGVLLIHGLFDSPFLVRDVGLHLQAQGLLTRAVLLPGHGTVPGALLHVDYQQWLQTIRYGIATFANEVDTLFLIGYSTGASLALYHILQEPASKIAGVVLLAPALKIRSALARLAHWHHLFSRTWPRAAWLNQDKNEMLDYARYRSVALNAAHQVYRLTQAIHKAGPAQLPLLFALSQDDNTVCSEASLRYFQHQAHPANQLILYSNTVSPYTDPRITVRHSAYPKLRIQRFSHLALPIAPDNPHYGEEGDYCYASHITRDDHTLFGEFSPMQLRFNDYLFHLKLSQYRYQRLSFNPDFDFLMRRITQFTRREDPRSP